MEREPIELPAELNALTERIIGCAIEVHRALGPGLLERLYEDAMVHELTLVGLAVERQRPVSLVYKGHELLGQRLDLVVAENVVVELKSIEKVLEVHAAQLLGYMRAGQYPLGLLLNFNVPVLRQGITRRINSQALTRQPAPQQSALGASSASSAPPPRPLRTAPPC
ncbi:MAG: GxxExxY protein [Phycisphaerales bacterium]|nr:GxxExxY protein [Phycisphaerales bacterium]